MMDSIEPKEYIVESICGHTTINGVDYFRVHWEGYSKAEDTWEPVENLTGCMKLLQQYQARHMPMQRERRKRRRQTKKPVVFGATPQRKQRRNPPRARLPLPLEVLDIVNGEEEPKKSKKKKISPPPKASVPLNLRLAVEESEYEREQRERKERNRQMAEALGLTSMMLQQPASPKEPRKRKETTDEEYTPRRSERIEGVPATMSLAEFSDSEPELEGSSSPGRKKRRSSGVREYRGGRVYDSDNGITCHQCRQKTIDPKSHCVNEETSTAPGKHRFCRMCLDCRYGENLDEVLQRTDWLCPYCRGDCNCSFCMPMRGRKPTGIMSPYVKSLGYESVRHFLSRGKEENA